MEEKKDLAQILELVDVPCFCVEDGRIGCRNRAASALFLPEGSEIAPLLLTGQQEYAAFSGGTLFLNLSIGGCAMSASVTKMNGMDIFKLEADSAKFLQVLTLAARELRRPLSSLFLALEPTLHPETEEARQYAGKIRRSLSQLNRLVGNMSDAGQGVPVPKPEMCNIGSVFRELFESASHYCQQAGCTLQYQVLEESIYTIADTQELERAFFNMLSNALKFTPRGGTIQASLNRRGRMLCLQMRDSGSGIPDEIRTNIHHRYTRLATLEDPNMGLGLGMLFIRTAALHHGGTVLIDLPEGGGTRVTMTLAIRQGQTGFRAPIRRVDYAGEWPHGLVELSDVLPASSFEPE